MSTTSGAGSPGRPRLLFVAFGFPPAAKSSSYRLREVGNQFVQLGWDVTVLNADRECWADDYGVDLSMLADVDPRIRLVEIPVRRQDLETDIRSFSRERAIDPVGWVKAWDATTMEPFPELKHGGWRRQVEDAAVALQRETPFDLVLVSCTPYVLLAAALRLHEEFGVPFAIDFRDGWSINVLTGEAAFPLESREGEWEARALASAASLWVVNEPIAEHYRSRYPQLADRVHVVRNGFDPNSVPAVAGQREPGQALRFGYLGTVNFPLSTMMTLLDAWKTARATDPLLEGATLEIRGHNGTSGAKHVNALNELLRAESAHGVQVGGPVPKADLAPVYTSWDVLLLILVGGRFVTSGKVYEYMATGHPILSVHEPEHDASTLLEGYPAWTGAGGVDRDWLVQAFSRAARLAEATTPASVAAARAHADRFRRGDLVAPAVARLAATVTA